MVAVEDFCLPRNPAMNVIFEMNYVSIITYVRCVTLVFPSFFCDKFTPAPAPHPLIVSFPLCP